MATCGSRRPTATSRSKLGEVVRGSVVLETQIGDLEVGIPEGTAAWLDVSATAGTVHNSLDAAEAPQSATETVEVRARTTVGEIAIGRPSRGDQHTPRRTR